MNCSDVVFPRDKDLFLIHGHFSVENQSIGSLVFEPDSITTPMIVKSCMIRNLCCFGTYFEKGLVLENCHILERADFGASGHNRLPIIIRNNRFEGFCTFDDAYYTTDISIINNHFAAGTDWMHYLLYPYGLAEDTELTVRGNTYHCEL